MNDSEILIENISKLIHQFKLNQRAVPAVAAVEREPAAVDFTRQKPPPAAAPRSTGPSAAERKQATAAVGTYRQPPSYAEVVSNSGTKPSPPATKNFPPINKTPLSSPTTRTATASTATSPAKNPLPPPPNSSNPQTNTSPRTTTPLPTSLSPNLTSTTPPPPSPITTTTTRSKRCTPTPASAPLMTARSETSTSSPGKASTLESATARISCDGDSYARSTAYWRHRSSSPTPAGDQWAAEREIGRNRGGSEQKMKICLSKMPSSRGNHSAALEATTPPRDLFELDNPSRSEKEDDAAAQRSNVSLLTVTGGKGFRELILNPQSLPYFQNKPQSFSIDPQKNQKLQTEPHYMQSSRFPPQTVDKIQIDPRIVCTNHFSALDDDFEISTACHVQKQSANDDRGWIFDCGATDTMTYDRSDFGKLFKANRTYVETAGGDFAPVEGAGTVQISPTLTISNCLYVPSLSQKLMSISHVTRELNCTLLMHPKFCLLQDIQTGTIIGQGTERRGLYYVDEIAQTGRVMLAHGSSERELWL